MMMTVAGRTDTAPGGALAGGRSLMGGRLRVGSVSKTPAAAGQSLDATVDDTRRPTGGPPHWLRPAASSDSVAARMSRQARRDTGPEVALRRELHRRGLRFRTEFPVPGMPRRRIDVAFTRAQIAIFVDGCFWHGCPEHKGKPASNSEWWAAKLAGNAARDHETDAHLRSLGWTVLRIWEHVPLADAADAVAAAWSISRAAKPGVGVQQSAVQLRRTGNQSHRRGDGNE